MSRRRARPGVAPRRADGSFQSDDAPKLARLAAPNNTQPRERHVPLPDDKLAQFEVVRVELLRGVWQGPGTIAQLRRELLEAGR